MKISVENNIGEGRGKFYYQKLHSCPREEFRHCWGNQVTQLQTSWLHCENGI